MKEALSSAGSEKRPSFIIRNVLVAHIVAYIVDKKLGQGCTVEGHKLLRKLLVKICSGEKVSVSRDVPNVYQGADLSIEVEGQKNIPPSGPTIFITNHTRGGPLYSMGQFFEMTKEAYEGRFEEENDKIREPFIIMQRGLTQGRLIQFLSGIFYEIAGQSLSCEVVDIPQFNSGEVINMQGLNQRAIARITNGGASLWAPQGTHRDANDMHFPENKGSGFIKKIHGKDKNVQLVPIRAIPDSYGNIKIIFGQAVDICDVVANGGINYFTKKHLAPLGNRRE